MLELLLNYLSHNKLLLLFIVIAIGYFLGKIKIKGFSLGIANVLFVRKIISSMFTFRQQKTKELLEHS